MIDAMWSGCDVNLPVHLCLKPTFGFLLRTNSWHCRPHQPCCSRGINASFPLSRRLQCHVCQVSDVLLKHPTQWRAIAAWSQAMEKHTGKSSQLTSLGRVPCHVPAPTHRLLFLLISRMSAKKKKDSPVQASASLVILLWVGRLSPSVRII